MYDTNKYETIRIEEPDLDQLRHLPLVQFLIPSMAPKTIVRLNKQMGFEKHANPDFSVNDLYFSEDPKKTEQELRSIKRRKCQINHQKMQLILAQRKKKIEMNQMVFYDKYNDFLVFQPKNMRQTMAILYSISKYN